MLPPAYSALPSRKLPSLPDQARVAVYVVMNIEHFTFGRLGTAIQPHLTSSPEIANYGWRDYGNRVGIWRLFELFAELGIPVTAALNAEMVELYPPSSKGSATTAGRCWPMAGTTPPATAAWPAQPNKS